jgi:hypothetical protein
MNPGMMRVRFGNNATHKKTRQRASGHFCLFPLESRTIMGRDPSCHYQCCKFVEEVLAIAQRPLRVLVDGNHDGLNVLVAVSLSRRHQPHFRKSLDPRRIIRLRPFTALCDMAEVISLVALPLLRDDLRSHRIINPNVVSVSKHLAPKITRVPSRIGSLGLCDTLRFLTIRSKTHSSATVTRAEINSEPKHPRRLEKKKNIFAERLL